MSIESDIRDKQLDNVDLFYNLKPSENPHKTDIKAKIRHLVYHKMSNFVVWQRCLIVIQFAHPLIAFVKLYEHSLNYMAFVKLCTPLHNRHSVFSLCLLL